MTSSVSFLAFSSAPVLASLDNALPRYAHLASYQGRGVDISRRRSEWVLTTRAQDRARRRVQPSPPVLAVRRPARPTRPGDPPAAPAHLASVAFLGIR
jgi:hypothetical protein